MPRKGGGVILFGFTLVLVFWEMVGEWGRGGGRGEEDRIGKGRRIAKR